jgi:predicted peptidase
MADLVFVLVMVAQLVPPVTREMQVRFDELQWRTQVTAENPAYRYRLFVPTSASPDNKLPLLVWLHGYGEHGDDNIKQLTYMDMIFSNVNDDPPLFILVVQHPKDATWTSSNNSDAKEPLSIAYEIMQRTLADYPIDPDRVYLSGVSAGGSAAFELACRHPKTFAALAPLASGGANVSRASRLVDIPIWAFHSSNDAGIPPDGVCEMVDAVNLVGGSAWLTMTDPNLTWSHDCWTVAFQDYKLMTWLLARRRGEVYIPWPTAYGLYRWLPFIFWPLFGTFICLLWRIEHKRKQNTHAVTNLPDRLQCID